MQNDTNNSGNNWLSSDRSSNDRLDNTQVYDDRVPELLRKLQQENDALQKENRKLRQELDVLRENNRKLLNTVHNLQIQLDSLEDIADKKTRKKARNGTW